MPEIELDGRGYVGYLELPTLELTLPVLSVSSDENLEIAPCRYFGTAYQQNFVIGGHRYRRHFRNLYTLGYGDTVIFTDVTGKQFVYQVEELEELQPYDSEYLCTGDWDLSLFTCTPGGTARVAVRCLKEDKR
jgi:sortase A